MILVDTSFWIDHLRRGEPQLVTALEANEVLMHPMVLGEIACGHLTNRGDTLRLLDSLPKAPMATDTEALRFIERVRLMGRGLGYVDVHLLAAVALGKPARLWTRDKSLAVIAGELSLL